VLSFVLDHGDSILEDSLVYDGIKIKVDGIEFGSNSNAIVFGVLWSRACGGCLFEMAMVI